jgi:hypothetical protein
MTTGSNRGQTRVLPEPRLCSPFMVQLLAYLHQWGLRQSPTRSGNSPTCRDGPMQISVRSKACTASNCNKVLSQSVGDV